MRNRPVALTGRPARAAARAAVRVAVRAQQRGFSLLEMLVALIVIVLVTTLAGVTVNSGGQDIQLEAMVRSLADTGGYALDEAQMTGVDYGLLIEEEQAAGATIYSYRWLERYVDGWRDPASGKEIFARQQLPPGIELQLELEEAPVVELSLEEKKEKEGLHPQVVFYASGETTVGALNVRKQGNEELLWRLEWDLLGRFKILRRGVPDEDEEENN